ncbi:VOC family protein [Methyloversatilis sp. XJ19-49]|uniref:VOC family protein n=1 Tax=Methyloversatilis sp. XJ19-49 TaxID=2963429 RepID=UPI00211C4FC8|nr:VOC family protein [Methyloversatilis sp. XJ19-49]MCQ9378302.1 VOC family protein [Methyloversatilis sp. XJ19-49]
MSHVKPIPDGMHTVTPHLVCADAAAAIAFYRSAFGAEERMRLAAPQGNIIHATIRIGDSTVMLVDAFAGCGLFDPTHLGGSPVTLHLQVADVDAVVARAVAAGATVTMPVDDAFWGDRYGKLKDPFGHEWSVATHLSDVSPDELQAAVRAMCSNDAGNPGGQ